MNMKSKTETLAAALRILANDIQSPDDIPATCLREAADSLEWLTRERDTEQKRADGHYENYCEILKQIDKVANERDDARAEVETRKKALIDAVEQIEGMRTLRDTWYDRAKKYEKERDTAYAEVERLKTELHDTIDSYKLNNLQPKTIRPEPSRLEIAAHLMAHSWPYDGVFSIICSKALEQADALIAAAKQQITEAI